MSSPTLPHRNRWNVPGRFASVLIVVLGCSCGAANTIAATSDAVYSVGQGVRFYERRDYEAAATAFETARNLAPNDLRIVYDLACALLGTNEAENTNKAIELFRSCAFARDKTLACDALLQLGDISVRKVETLYKTTSSRKNDDDVPTGTSWERERILTELRIAENCFEDCLLVDSERNDARGNLEIVRQWKTRIRQEWLFRQRQAFSNNHSFFTKVRLWNEDQRLVRNKVRAAVFLPDSPKNRQSLYLLRKDQHELSVRAGELRELFLAMKEETKTASPRTETSPTEDREIARRTGDHLETATKWAASAARQLRDTDGNAALDSLSFVVEKWNDLQCELFRYEELLWEAVKLQEALLSAHAARPDEPGEALWNLGFVHRWIPAIRNKACRERESLRERIAGLNSEHIESSLPSDLENPAEEIDFREKTDDELLLASMELAVTHCPEIETTLAEAISLMRESRWNDAKNKQIAAKTLLLLILAPLEERTQGLPDSQADVPDRSSGKSDRGFSDESVFQDATRDGNGEGSGESGDSSAEEAEENDRNSKTPGTGEKNVEKTAGETANNAGGETEEPAEKQASDENSPSRFEEPTSLFGDSSGNEGEFGTKRRSSDKRLSDRLRPHYTEGDVGRGVPDALDSSQSLDPAEASNAEFASDYEQILRQAERENADVLIRAIKRRQSEAKKYRQTIRTMLHPEIRRAEKDW